MAVFVLDKLNKPLMPCSEKRARLLLTRERAVVHRMVPFTIRLRDRTVENSKLQLLRLKLDPGSKTTGFAVLLEKSSERAIVIWLGEFIHKVGIKDRLDTRRAVRRSRRIRKTRYRAPRFLNRKRKEKWLPPSLEARVQQTLNSVGKLQGLLPLSTISTEHAKFDTQLLQNPQIQGVEYQQGTLFGYEVREYLLEKFQWTCAYCEGASKDHILEVDHVIPKNPKIGSKGTNQINNLVIACHTCNDAKGNIQPQNWLEELQKSPKKVDRIRIQNLPKILKQSKNSLRDAAFMNATRWKLYENLKNLGLSVEGGTGARTKMQRLSHNLPKTHYYDAACVGASTPNTLIISPKYIDQWTAIGRGNRCMANVNKYGFPITHRKAQKQYYGFQTGDIIKANVSRGKYTGTWHGRVAVRSRGYFDIKDGSGKRICQSVSYKHCSLIQRNNGWYYSKTKIQS